MNLICALPVLLLAIIPVYTQKIVDGVYELTQADFGPFIESNDHVLVEFYTPWCKHCKPLTLEFVKAAADLKQKNPKIKLAKINIESHPGVANTHGVSGIPTVKLFHKKVVVDYTGQRTAQAIVDFTLQQCNRKPALTELKKVAEANALIESSDCVVIGFFNNQQSEGAKTYIRAASGHKGCVFAITSDTSVFSKFSASDNAVILSRKADNKRIEFEGQLEQTQLKDFFTSASRPVILDFNEQTKSIVFDGKSKLQLICFVRVLTTEILEALRTTANALKNPVLFVIARVTDQCTSGLQDFFGVKPSDAPAMRMIDLKEAQKKFKPNNGDLSSNSMKQFVEDVESGNIPQYVKSEDLPSDWNQKSLWRLVGSNFAEVAYDPNKNVLVSFSAPWCGPCKQLEPILEQVGKHFENDDSVVVAKIDATANEVPNIQISGYPTIFLFRKGDNKAISYNQARSASLFINFIKNSGS